jgi:CelD/BcsL family acetyltransferase involved in cellulose biosynthesis
MGSCASAKVAPVKWTYEVKQSQSVTAYEREAWGRLCRVQGRFASPYLTPEFFDAVGAETSSARVLIGRDDCGSLLFFPFHRNALGIGHPIGGPLCDVHGVITDAVAGPSPDHLMRATGLSVIAFAHAPASDPVLGHALARRHAFHVIDLADGFEAYHAVRSEVAKSAFRAIRTRLRKAESLHGPIRFTWHDTDPVAFETLLTWKRKQFAATGQIDPLQSAWIRSLLGRLLGRDGSPLHAPLATLHFGDRLAAVHLGLASSSVLHYWFPAYDPELQELSPGNLLLFLLAQNAPQRGVEAIHLGAGDYRYKHEFANCALPMVAGTLFGAGATAALAATGRSAVAWASRALPESMAHLPERALRRLDRQLALAAL